MRTKHAMLAGLIGACAMSLAMFLMRSWASTSTLRLCWAAFSDRTTTSQRGRSAF